MNSQNLIIFELRKTLGKMEVALGAVSDAIVWTDSNGYIQWCNRVFDEWVGLPHIAVLGKKFSKVFPLSSEDNPPFISTHPIEILLHGGTFNGEHPIYNRVGSTSSYEVSGNTITVVQDEKIAILSLKDVTSLLRSKEALEKANLTLESRVRQRTNELEKISNQYRSILENAVDAIITISSKGKILSINPAAENIFGFMEKEVLGENVNILMPSPFKEKHDSYLKTYLATGKKGVIGIGRETYAQRRDGQTFPIELAVSEVRTADNIFFTGIIRDISVRKEAEEALQRAKEEAEYANDAKSQFLSQMSHEIRTPMNAVLGMAEMLEESVLNAEQSQYVRVLKNAGDHLLNVIDDILDLARIEAGQLQLHQTLFQLPEIITETCSIMQVGAQKKHLVLEYIIDPLAPANIIGDSKRLQQILINLLGNAIKFTETGGVTLEVYRQSIPEPNEEENNIQELLFSVSDTGIGIAKEKQEEIFGSFSQEDPYINRKYGGAGLGLSICQALVEKMHGQIWVESEKNKGSIFYFTARFREQAVTTEPGLDTFHSSFPATKNTDQSKANWREEPLNILLAEDSYDNRFLVQSYLKKLPCRIVTAENGRIAVDTYQSGNFDIVLMDIQMPILDGYGAVREIRAWEKNTGRKAVPILALTAHAQKSAQQESLAAGCNRHLIKPLRKEELIGHIVELTAISVDAGGMPPLPIAIHLQTWHRKLENCSLVT